jgi:hypothetical protein
VGTPGVEKGFIDGRVYLGRFISPLLLGGDLAAILHSARLRILLIVVVSAP